ncbi:MAG TPA: hypothetical protein VD902_21055, partial [Symbiobacteriaceae bacterium]|nr:hypothetical protein [Symbiobacteriaceae bacterium]
MNESFDQELTRAFKESTAKSLQGWEFTPAMRSRVLERIRQEETAAPAPTEPPVTGFRPQRIIRPLSWVAVAAAAVLVVFNLGPSIGSKKSEAPQLTMSSAPAQEPGMRSAMKSAPGAPETESAAQQADAASGEGAASTAEATVTAIPPAENVRLAPMNVTVVALTAPASDVGPRTGAPEGPGEGKMSVAAAGSVLNLAISAPADGPVVTLTAEGVKVLSSDDTVLWEQSVANLDPASSVLAAAPDGLVAVGNGGNELHLFGAGGTTDQTVLATANIERLAWSADGRVASAEGAMTVVYNGRNGRQEFSVEAGSEADLAWAPDGVLATLGTE